MANRPGQGAHIQGLDPNFLALQVGWVGRVDLDAGTLDYLAGEFAPLIQHLAHLLDRQGDDQGVARAAQLEQAALQPRVQRAGLDALAQFALLACQILRSAEQELNAIAAFGDAAMADNPRVHGWGGGSEGPVISWLSSEVVQREEAVGRILLASHPPSVD